MTGPLDDAARKLDQDEEFIVGWRAKQAGADQEQHAKFVALVGDFLETMHRAGDPGADREWKTRRFKKVRAWFFTYEDGEKPGTLFLTVDGRIPQVSAGGRGGFELEPYTTYHKALTDSNIESLGKNMVKLLRSTGVRR